MKKSKDNKNLWIIIGVSAVVLIGLIAFFAFNGKDSGIENNEASLVKTPQDNIDMTPKTYSVYIKNSTFKPSSLTIKVGDTVKWVNNETMKHTINANNKEFNSDYLIFEETFSHIFDSAGEYDYFCDLHPEARGKIIVAARV